MSKPLKVEPAALSSMADELATLAGENIRAENYVKEWVSPSGNAGGKILSHVTVALESLERDLIANYARLSRVISGSSIQLGNAATMYKTTDYESAAALDRTYPGAAQ
ncbi:type VII secretion target [Nocardia lasii]|uniref:Type VII secretion target n=1 Tax=Nocardia lasii TaxID=1616107 RepID=A0ABW1JQT5_9NOCA